MSLSLSDGLRFALLRQHDAPASDSASAPQLDPVQPSNLNWMAIPRDDPGLAYLYHANELQCIVDGGKVLFRTPRPSQKAMVLDMAASGDGRMVAVAWWHTTSNQEEAIASDSNILLYCYNVTSNGGFEERYTYTIPATQATLADVRAMSFGSNHTLALVDSDSNLHFIQNNGVGKILRSNATSASFAPNGNFLAVGLIDGTINIYNAALTMKSASTIKAAINSTWDFPMAGPQCPCTHLDWVSLDVLVAGYCRVTPGDDPPEDADMDDEADHEAFLFVNEMEQDFSLKECYDLGDVVPFFNVPKGRRHNFYTCCLIEKKLMLVATNLGSEIKVVAYEDKEWKIIDVPEGDDVHCPTSDDDEFTFPTGLGIMITAGKPVTVLASTSGSLSYFSVLHEQHSTYFDLPLMEPMLPQAVVPLDDTQSIAVAAACTLVPAKNAEIDVSSADPAITTLEITSSSAETPVLNLQGVEPTFVSMSSGSGTDLPTFGTGTAAPTFCFSSPAGSRLQVGAASGAASATSMPFNIFEKRYSVPVSSMVKPLFGSNANQVKLAATPAATHELSSPAAEKAASVFDLFDTEKVGSLPLSMLEIMVDELGEGFCGDEFDVQVNLIDQNGTGTLDRSSFISWYQQFAEGNEKNAFNDDNSMESFERAERAEEAENARKAFLAIAKKESGSPVIQSSQFEELMESLGTTYHDEDHGQALKRLERQDGCVHLDDFATWYVKFLFDEDGDSDDGKGNRSEVDVLESSPSQVVGGWGTLFKSDPSNWKCVSCMVSNNPTVNQCAACQVSRPGSQEQDVVGATADASAFTIESSIGPQGFSCGGSLETFSSAFTLPSTQFAAPATGGFRFGSSEREAVTLAASPGATKGSEASAILDKARAAVESRYPPASSSAPKNFDSCHSANRTLSTQATLSESGERKGSLQTPAGDAQSSDNVYSPDIGVSDSHSTPGAIEPVTAPVFGSGSAAATQPFIFPSSTEVAIETRLAPSAQINIVSKPMLKSPSSEAVESHMAAIVPSSDAATTAALAFDSHDKEKSGLLPRSMLLELIEQLGEEFSGEELNKQASMIDTKGTGMLNRSSFISWYHHFTEMDESDKGDELSLNSDDRAERVEEAEKAKQIFLTIATRKEGEPFVQASQFEILINSMGATYCEEEHGKALNQLAKSGQVFLDDFLKWYITYLFDEECESDTETSKDKRTVAPSSSQSASWGITFRTDPTSWKCNSCLVLNQGAVFTCAACETPRSRSKDAGAAGNSVIGGVTVAPALAAEGSTGSFAGGSTFDGPAPGSDKVGVSSDKEETAATSCLPADYMATTLCSVTNPEVVAIRESTSSKFKANFTSAPLSSSVASVANVAKTSGGKQSVKAAKSSDNLAYPPIEFQAPTPFDSIQRSTGSLKPETVPAMPMSSNVDQVQQSSDRKPSAKSAYPPIDFQAPKPFGSDSKVAPSNPGISQNKQSGDRKPSAGSAYPSIDFQAPKPLGSDSKVAPSDPGISQNKQSGDRKPSAGSAYPPTDFHAPKPFGSDSKVAPSDPCISQNKQSDDRKPSAGSAYPPTDFQAPKPFGSDTKVAPSDPGISQNKQSGDKKQSAGSAYPPTDFQAPKPFAPKPFGSDSKVAPSNPGISQNKQSGDRKPSAGSAYPSIDFQAPKPLGSDSKVAPSDPGISQNKQSGDRKPSAGSAYPPTDFHAPKPFGSDSKVAPSDPCISQNKQSDDRKPSAGSAYPPTDFQAPKPFGSDTKVAPSDPGISQNKQSGDKKQSAGSAYPPTDFQAPKPFGSNTKLTEFVCSSVSQHKQSSEKRTGPTGSVYPPFDFEKKQDIESAKMHLATPAYPSIELSPLSFDVSNTASGTSLNTSIPVTKFDSTQVTAHNVECKAPTPSIGSQNTGAADSITRSQQTLAGLAAMSPAAATNTAFKKDDLSQLTTVTQTEVGATRSFAQSSNLVPSGNFAGGRRQQQNRTVMQTHHIANENVCTLQFASLCGAMREILASLSNCSRDNGGSELHSLDVVIAELNRLISACHELTHSIQSSKRQISLVLGKRSECHRRVSESQFLMENVRSDYRNEEDFFRWQPLDLTSEKRRRSLISSVILVDKYAKLLQERLSLLMNLEGSSGSLGMLSGVKNHFEGFERSKEGIMLVIGTVEALTSEFYIERQPSEMSFGLLSPAKPAVKSAVLKAKHKWAEVENLMQELSVPDVKLLSCSNACMATFQSTEASHRSASRQKIVRKHATPSLSLQQALIPRPEWDEPITMDKVQASRVTFTPPSILSQTAFSDAGNAALKTFGATRSIARETDYVCRHDPQASVANKSPPRSFTARESMSARYLTMEPRSTGASRKSSRDEDESAKNQTSADNHEPPTVKQFADLSGIAGSLFSLSNDDLAIEFDQVALKAVGSESPAGNSFSELRPSSIALGEVSDDSTPTVGSSSSMVEDEQKRLDQTEFYRLLVNFYHTHNPLKLDEVKATLEKYVGKEMELFEKLSKKYGVENPLRLSTSKSDNTGTATSQAVTSAAAAEKVSPQRPLLFNKPATVASSTNLAHAPTPPFGSAQSALQSPFMQPPPALAELPKYNTTSPFNQTSQNSVVSSTSRFASPSNGAPVPFGTPELKNNQGIMGSIPVAPSQANKDPRQMLIEFYQQQNPSKLADVDKLLTKYQGQHESMFRNLAKKYEMDPAVFGLSGDALTPSGSVSFGQNSPLGTTSNFGCMNASSFKSQQGGFVQASPGGASFGQASVFGQTSTPSSMSGVAGFGSPTPLGGGGLFGQLSPVTGFGTTVSGGFGASAPAASFGALASSTPGANFASPGAGFGSPFGSVGTNATPFGAARR
ncbi:hypothetical protein MPSEU_000899500 [Mayamaea pseudoterrestris]|nr:hypothetical protein MPSEU_000899500 [Mayamaea pseudoterrestris]